MDRAGRYERAALARVAYAAILAAEVSPSFSMSDSDGTLC